MTDPNFRVALRALEQRSGVENLGEPEVTTTSGRQTQMRATQVVTVVTDVNFQQGTAAQTGNGTGTAIGTGQANTTLIVNGCSTAGIAARICDEGLHRRIAGRALAAAAL